MLSQFTKYLYGNFVNLCHFMGFSPFLWDFGLNRISVCPTQCLKWYISSALLWLHVAILLFKFVSTNYDVSSVSTESWTQKYFHAYLLALFLLPIYLGINTMRKCKLIAYFVNQTMIMDGKLKGKYGLTYLIASGRDRDGFEKYMFVMTLAGIGNVTVFMLYYLANASATRYYIYNLFKSGLQFGNHWIIAAFFIPIEAWYIICIWCIALFYMFTILIWFFHVQLWLRKMSKSKQDFNEHNWTTVQRIKVFKCFMLSVNIFEDCFRNWVIPGHSIVVGLCHTGSNYAALKFYNRMPIVHYFFYPILSFAMFVFEAIAYSKAASVYEYSEMFVDSWRKVDAQFHHKKDVQKSLKGLRRLRIENGHCFHYTKKTVLTFFQILINSTINLLLVYP